MSTAIINGLFFIFKYLFPHYRNSFKNYIKTHAHFEKILEPHCKICYKNNTQNETHLKSHRCPVVVINRWTAGASCISHMCTPARVTAFSDLPPHPVAPRQALYAVFIVSSGFSLCTSCSLGAQSRHTPTKPTATSSHGRTPLHLVVCTGSCFPALSCPFLPLPEMLSSRLPHRVCRRQQSGPGRRYVGNTLPPDPTLRNARGFVLVHVGAT